MRRIAQATALATTVLLAGCAGGQGLLDTKSTEVAASEIIIPGRWYLSAPNAPACGMNFAAAVGGSEGTVVPDGGCPGKFYTSRRWSLVDKTLTISDDEKEALATLTFASGHFEGKSVNDLPVTLKR